MMPLPASNEAVLEHAVNPALAYLPATMRSDAARRMLLAIGRQESGFATRRQYGDGPARGLWQFERGGVLGVMHHSATGRYAFEFCEALGQPWGSSGILAALEHDDVLAAGFARLLLWTDPSPLPAIGDEDAAYEYYVRNWRPGKPSRLRWAGSYPAAVETVRAIA
jgi:hypothetical protein